MQSIEKGKSFCHSQLIIIYVFFEFYLVFRALFSLITTYSQNQRFGVGVGKFKTSWVCLSGGTLQTSILGLPAG